MQSNSKLYKIGELADHLNIKVDTIRYYEKIGLIPKPMRQENDYRVYSERYIEILKFIMIAKNNGFTLKEIRRIIALLASQGSDSEELLALTKEKIEMVNQKIKELTYIKGQLNDLVYNCDPDLCEVMSVFTEEPQQN